MQPSDSPKHDRHWFQYRGKRWRIFKRGKSDKWYIIFQRHKERTPLSLGETARETAVQTAKVKIDAWLDQRLDVLRASMERPKDLPKVLQYSTVGEIIAALDLAPIDAKEAARKGYAWSLRWLVQKATGNKLDAIDGMTADIFEGDTLAKNYFNAMRRWMNEAPNQRESAKRARNAHFIFSQGKAVFSDRALVAYQDAGLVLPDMTPFRKAMKIHGFKASQRGDADRVEIPSEKIIRRTYLEWMRMARRKDYFIPGCDDAKAPSKGQLTEQERRNVFLAVGHELSCGLRKGEMVQARWSWLTSENGVPLLVADDEVSVKNRSGRLRVVPLDPFWTFMQRAIERNEWKSSRDGSEGSEGDYILAGSQTDRDEYVFYYVGKWLRWLGWKTQKTNHALRDLGASLITMKYGLDHAKKWCRHNDFKTTQKHYGHFVRDTVMLAEENPLPWLRFVRRKR